MAIFKNVKVGDTLRTESVYKTKLAKTNIIRRYEVLEIDSEQNMFLLRVKGATKGTVWVKNTKSYFHEPAK